MLALAACNRPAAGLPPVLFALELNEEDKAALDRIQGQDGALIKLKS